MTKTRTVAAALAAAILAGCGAAPLDYHPQTEIPRGPGLISGEEGAFVMRFDEQDEFRDWKKSAEGSAEYQEFQEWREWREWKRRNAK